jgi:hypothetical protein
MQFFDKLVQKTIMRRTGYKALIDGMMITGCSQCKFNIEVPGIMAMAPGHRCSMTMMSDGKGAIIWDPANIPEFCPFRFKEVNGELVSGVQ